jgi:2'-5' RNA ligase
MRLFVAAWAREIGEAPPPGFRPVPMDQRHLTLVFVGEESRVAEVGERIAEVARRHRPFSLSFEREVGLPTARAAKVAAIEAAYSEPFALLVGELRAALVPYGQVARETRPPRPHVTTGRRREPLPLSGRRLPRPFRVEVRSFSLVESRLLPGGPAYTELARYVLGEGASASWGVLE